MTGGLADLVASGSCGKRRQVVVRVKIEKEAVQRDAAGGFGRRLRSREPLMGTVVTVPSVALAELVAEPVDFVWIDLEHGALGVADVQPLAVACRAADAIALVRLPCDDVPGIGAILDAGADGVVAPRLETADCAARLVERLRYPLRGSRGLAARRGSRYGRQGSPGGSADPLCLVQIESPRGVEAAADIAAVDGVAALVVGCADLSQSLGEEGRLLGSPNVVDAVEHVQLAAAAAGIASGIAGPDDPVVLAELAAGRSTVLVLSADVRMYARAVDSAVAALRREQAARAPEPADAHVGS
jgi:4-hydroxy-2-oxoheptanedioate aldolase